MRVDEARAIARRQAAVAWRRPKATARVKPDRCGRALATRFAAPGIARLIAEAEAGRQVCLSAGTVGGDVIFQDLDALGAATEAGCGRLVEPWWRGLRPILELTARPGPPRRRRETLTWSRAGAAVGGGRAQACVEEGRRVWKQAIRDIDRGGKPEPERVDLNRRVDVGRITDNIGMRAVVPTSPWLLGPGAAALQMAHLGRPNNPEGESQRPAPAASPEPPRWERCVITIERVDERWLRPFRHRFVADAVGPHGHYRAGHSAAFGEDIYGAEARARLSGFLATLTKRGWTIVTGPRSGPASGRGQRAVDDYWAYRLQRATK